MTFDLLGENRPVSGSAQMPFAEFVGMVPEEHTNKQWEEFNRLLRGLALERQIPVYRVPDQTVTVLDSFAAQQEAFLAHHLDKIGTHRLWHFPQEWSEFHPEDKNGEIASNRLIGTAIHHQVTQLICLVPNEITVMPPEEARTLFPHTERTFTLILEGTGISLVSPPYFLKR